MVASPAHMVALSWLTLLLINRGRSFFVPNAGTRDNTITLFYLFFKQKCANDMTFYWYCRSKIIKKNMPFFTRFTLESLYKLLTKISLTLEDSRIEMHKSILYWNRPNESYR